MASLNQIYVWLQTRGKDGHFVSMGGAPRRQNANRAPASTPTGGDGATPPLRHSARLAARPSSPTSGSDTTKKTEVGTAPLLLAKKKAGGASSSSTSGGAGAKRLKMKAGGASLLPYPPAFDVAALRRQAAEAGGPRRCSPLLPYQPRFTIIDLPAAPEQEEEETKPNVTCLQPLSKKEWRVNKGKEVPIDRMSFWKLHNNLAASQKREEELEEELAKETEKRKALKLALERAAARAAPRI
ncbi:uncharacterized protein LOC120654102 [Panicum virgatum]|uniref:Uncharacterized protein n=1 Tax=Panicum virgatum TaxID=38727 RepID=A0A8T0WQL6_PANVG|nr:uncharacterized protein LOC120654102 [Panicum virgatum]KAG2651422.1 hypothetical protein PVAP13_1NG447400 [Panicum virgatum]